MMTQARARLVTLIGSILIILAGILIQTAPRAHAQSPTVGGDQATTPSSSTPQYVPSPVQQNAGIIVSVIGFLSLLIPGFWKDRSEKRALEAQQLQKQIDELTAKNKAQAAELDSVRSRLKAVMAESVAAHTEASAASQSAQRAHQRVDVIDDEVIANRARIGGLAGYTEGMTTQLVSRKILIPPKPLPGQSRPRQTIVIVEDSDEAARILMAFFFERGFSPSHAPTIDEAKKYLMMRPHWALIDVRLASDPRAGLEIIRWIRAQQLTCRIAVLTGAADPNLIAEIQSMLLPSDVYLPKPIDLDELLSKIIPEYGDSLSDQLLSQELELLPPPSLKPPTASSPELRDNKSSEVPSDDNLPKAP